MRNELVSLSSLKWRSRLALRDGSRVNYVSYTIDGTIDRAGKRAVGVFHRAQERCGISYFKSHGYCIFPRHIGLHGAKGWADFAAARYRRVILVECMTDWFVDSTLERKAELAEATELWFIAEQYGMKKLRKRGYHCRVLPQSEADYSFWLCRPRGAKAL